MKIAACASLRNSPSAVALIAVVASAFVASPLLAQSAGTIVPPKQADDAPSSEPVVEPPPQAAVPEPTTTDNQLEEIIITAQRRSESAQRVPISITAISGEAIEAAAVKDLTQLTKSVVGIQYDGNSTQRPELFIRGIGTNRFDIGSDPSSGVFIDEVYQPRFANVLTGLVDVERIEILRGPQGTLFGRNTIGGAISVTSADPSKTFDGLVTGSYGNKDYVNLGGTVTGPLSDRVRFRLSGGYSDRTGFMRDTISGQDDGTKSATVRGKLDFDLTERLTFKLAGSYFYSRQSALLLNPLNTPIFVASPIAPQVVDNEPFSGSYTTPGGNTIKSGQVNGRLELAGNDVTTTVIGAWIGFRQRPSQDLDGNVIDAITYRGNEHTNTYSAELRFGSTDGGRLTFGDKFKWIAGLYLFKDKGSSLQDFTFGRDGVVSFLVANPTLMPPFRPGTISKTDSSDIFTDLKSAAVYGQGTFAVTDRIGLTLGGRYTHDRRDFVFVGSTTLRGLPSIPTPYRYDGDKTSEAFTPRVALDFRPVKDTLLYVSWSRGFKSSAIQSTPISIATASRVTEPEKVDAFELGLKSELLQRRLRLNIAVFENKFENLQVRRVVTFPGGFSTALSENAADSRIKGVEVEGSALVTTGLRFNASYAYLDAKYGTYIADPVAGLDFSGNRLPRAPRNRFNVDGTYTTRVAGDYEVQARAAYSYTGSFYFQPSNSVLEKESPYGLADASVQVSLPDAMTTVQAWTRNLFNITYRNYLDPLDLERLAGYGERRTYGLTLTRRF